ncbi:hypothetical protein [Paenibacillus sp. M2]|uniref:hypothetical protein n=1 Tax=Paenibacillus sp. M2 TaxID=3341793 RepID=UPI003988B730
MEQTLKAAVNGSPETVRGQLESFIQQTQADELIITSMIYDHKARLHSYELIAQWQGKA